MRERMTYILLLLSYTARRWGAIACILDWIKYDIHDRVIDNVFTQMALQMRDASRRLLYNVNVIEA